MKFKRSEKLYPAESRPIQCHNCPRQFKNFHSLKQHRRAKHYISHIRIQFHKSRHLNLKTDKFSLAVDNLARLLECIYISREHPRSALVNMT